ncbi:MAG: hypothetical protein ABI855_00380 [Bacteroidota bacterium]
MACFHIPLSFWSLNIGDVLTGILMPFCILFIPLFFKAKRNNKRLAQLRNFILNQMEFIEARLRTEKKNNDQIIEFLQEKNDDIPGHVVDIPVEEVLSVNYQDMPDVLVENLNTKNEEKKENMRADFYHLLYVLKDIKEHFAHRKTLIDNLTTETNYFNKVFFDKLFEIQKLIIKISDDFKGAGKTEQAKNIELLMEKYFNDKSAYSTHKIFDILKEFFAVEGILNTSESIQLTRVTNELLKLWLNQKYNKLSKLEFYTRDGNFYNEKADWISYYISRQKKYLLKTKFLDWN